MRATAAARFESAWANESDSGTEEMTDFSGRWWLAGAMLTLPRRRTRADERPTTRVRLTLKDGSTRDKVVAHPRGTGDRVLTNAI